MKKVVTDQQKTTVKKCLITSGDTGFTLAYRSCLRQASGTDSLYPDLNRTCSRPDYHEGTG